MKVNELQRLFGALDRSAQKADQEVQQQQPQVDQAAAQSTAAVQIEVAKPASDDSESDDVRANKVARFKELYNKGELRAADSNVVGAVLLRDLF